MNLFFLQQLELEDPTALCVYRLHFPHPVGRIRHYTGSTTVERLRIRLLEHALGYGGRTTARLCAKNDYFFVDTVRIVPDRAAEQAIKKQEPMHSHCSICKNEDAFKPYAIHHTPWLWEEVQAFHRELAKLTLAKDESFLGDCVGREDRQCGTTSPLPSYK